MRPEPGEEALVGVICDAVFPARLLDDAGERRVVYMANLGEQVVLHLVVEPSQVPGQEMVVLVEIRGGAQLVHHPARIHLLGIPRVHGEARVLVAVGELKHDRHYQPLKERHQHVEHDDIDNGIEKERYHESHRQEEELAPEKDNGVPSLRAVYLVPVYFFREERVEVVEQVPLDREEAVERPYIEVLPAVEEIPLVVRTQAREDAGLDVVVVPRDIGI